MKHAYHWRWDLPPPQTGSGACIEIRVESGKVSMGAQDVPFGLDKAVLEVCGLPGQRFRRPQR